MARPAVPTNEMSSGTAATSKRHSRSGLVALARVGNGEAGDQASRHSGGRRHWLVLQHIKEISGTEAWEIYVRASWQFGVPKMLRCRLSLIFFSSTYWN